MKKIFTLIFLFAIVFSVSAQKKIAYVTSGTQPTDAILAGLQLAATNSGGLFTVTTFDLAALGTATASNITTGNYDMVVISEWPSTSTTGWAELEGLTATLPILMMKVHAYGSASPRWNWATSFDQTTDGTTIGVTLTTDGAASPIFTGVSGATAGATINLITAAGSKGLTWADPSSFLPAGVGASIKSLAYVSSMTTANQSILEIPVGTVIGGAPTVTTGKKFIQIGINSISYPNISSDGAKIIANSCLYLMDLPLGTTNKMAENAFLLAPNPSNGEFTINFNEKSTDASVEVKAMDGRVVYHSSVQADAMNMNLSHLSSGVYFVTYVSNNTAGTKKVIIK